ncbi:MAG: cupin [Vulcanococcus sp.]|jgi:gentisate 1,2-dioxygenase|uniref:cupin n=1 Tax=Vulcanococcus sp. TaxID=2856995 RepID=UPI0025DB6666|nr:cupin [Vulcanococcus sp.]MBW0175166.1 cupin [Vulcanococcus sp.]MBW0181417.1 cupin [Vulcanococcus sp.]
MTQAPERKRHDEPAASKALLFDYRQAANPVRPGLTDPIPYRSWGPELHQQGPTGILPLDLSAELGVPGPATSPALAAHFIRIEAGEGVRAAAEVTSSLFFVLSGSGVCRVPPADGSSPTDAEIHWQQGDLFVLPAGGTPLLEASSTSVLYWVHDGPLLSYLGVSPSAPRFEPTHYSAAWMQAELEELARQPGSSSSNRVSLLLANRDLPSTRTVTHVLWAMFGIVPAGATQAPHRHQSVALDLIINCQPGVYTLVGTELNSDGSIRNPRRLDWQSGGAFITPPGHWHSHVNESGQPAWLLPIQDAGLHTYLRSLDIRFV